MNEQHDKLWDLMEKIGFCMLVDESAGHLRARPMTPRLDRAGSEIFFLADARHRGEGEIEANPQVCLAFAEPGGQKYVSVSGRARLSADRSKIDELWSTAAKAWWDSPADSNIRVLAISPDEAEYWEGPGTMIAKMKMAAAAATNRRPDMGEHEKVDMG